MKTHKPWIFYLAGGLVLASSATTWFIVALQTKQAKVEAQLQETAIQTLEGEGGIILD